MPISFIQSAQYQTLWDKWLLLVHVTHLILLLPAVLKFFKFILLHLHHTFYLESTAGLQFRVFYWPSWPLNLFTFRLLTPPGTPLFPSHEAAPKRSPVSQTGSPKTRQNSLKSRVSHWNMTITWFIQDYLLWWILLSNPHNSQTCYHGEYKVIWSSWICTPLYSIQILFWICKQTGSPWIYLQDNTSSSHNFVVDFFISEIALLSFD